MAIIFSSIAMLILFGVIVVAERKHTKRSKEFFRQSDEMIADLASRAEERYKAKFGKDPTGKIAILKDKGGKQKPA